MPKVTDEYKEKKRAEIIEFAMKCFAKKGYHATTVDDIVELSGTSKGSVYHYFKSKEEIYLTLLAKSRNELMVRVQTMFANPISAKEKLNQLIGLYEKIKVNDQEWFSRQRVHMEFWILASRNEVLRGSLIEHSNEFIKLIQIVIEEGKENREFKSSIDSKSAAQAFWSMIDGMFLHMMAGKEEYPFKSTFTFMMKMWLDSLIPSSK